MKQSRHHLAEVIAEKTLHVTDAKLLAKEIAAYLLDNKQVGDLQSLMRDIIQYRANNGIVEAIAASASELPQDVLDDIKKMLEANYPAAKRIIVRQKRDDSVVGGLRIDMANEQLDMSVKAKLNTFKRLTALERNKA